MRVLFLENDVVTRKEYMAISAHHVGANKELRVRAHRDYYAQFVTDRIINLVLSGIGKDKILASKCDHFNDIPMRMWDPLVKYLGVSKKMHDCGDYLTMAGGICILKEAAQQIKEKHQHA